MNNRGLVVVLIVLVAILLLAPGFGFGLLGPGMIGPGMMRGFGRGPFFGGIPTWQWALGLSLHWLGTLAFWGAVIVGIILVVRWLGGERREGQTPQEILKRRYASGEITGEQYEQMRRALES